MKNLIAAAAAIAVLGVSASAFAETLTYDLTMVVTKLEDAVEPGTGPKGVFESGGMAEGKTFDVHVELSTSGTPTITVEGVKVESTNKWGWANYQDGKWSGGGGENNSLNINTIPISYGSIHNLFDLYVSKTSSGDLIVNSGSMHIWLDNSVRADLWAEVIQKPVSTPELDPASGTGAFALLLGGLALAVSSRPRFSIARA